jgi:diketogulonate reductase-like aldo/keto reductase
VPIPASTTPEHVVENLAAAGTRLSPAECERIEKLRDPGFER